jgi:hypothetical protein
MILGSTATVRPARGGADGGDGKGLTELGTGVGGQLEPSEGWFGQVGGDDMGGRVDGLVRHDGAPGVQSADELAGSDSRGAALGRLAEQRTGGSAASARGTTSSLCSLMRKSGVFKPMAPTTKAVASRASLMVMAFSESAPSRVDLRARQGNRTITGSAWYYGGRVVKPRRVRSCHDFRTGSRKPPEIRSM